jgi:quercetin dioxygenase-like cupin family protein
MKSDVPQPVFVQPRSGQMLEYLGVTHKLTSDQTGGAYYLFESTFGPGDGNKLHVHRREDEVGYVLEGALEIRLGDQTLAVSAGGVAHLPKNIPHAIRNPLQTPSRYLFMTVPGGLDHWFDAVEAASKDGAMDDAAFHKLSLEYGLEWLE